MPPTLEQVDTHTRAAQPATALPSSRGGTWGVPTVVCWTSDWTVDYETFIKSQLARTRLTLWYIFGHVTPQNVVLTKPS